MSSSSFIDRALIESALEHYTTNKNDIDTAMKLCTSFCKETFGISGCMSQKIALTTFCATTIFFSTKRKFLDRKRGGQRDFEIERDLVNELNSACIETPPIPMIRSIRSSKKHQAHHQKGVVAFSDIVDLDAYALSLSETVVDEESTPDFIGKALMSVMTPFEKELIYALDGDLKLYKAMQLGLRRKEAEVVIDRICKKVASMEHLYFDSSDATFLKITDCQRTTKLQISREEKTSAS